MDTMVLSDHTFLLIGLGIFLAVSVGVVLPNLLPTARCRVNRRCRELRFHLYELQQAEKAAKKAVRTQEKLRAKVQQISPKRMREAEERASDLITMLAHAKENVMVAENHVRRVLLEEYPPAKHRLMLDKFLPEQN